MTSLERNRTCRSKGQRRLFRCSCGQVVVKKGQHLLSRKFHPELVGVPVTTSLYLKKLKSFKKLKYDDVKKELSTKPADGANYESGESGDEEEGFEEGFEEEPEFYTLTKAYVLGLKKNARVMKGRRDFKEVIEWREWRHKRVGGGKSAESTEKAKVMINRFLALMGFVEGGDLSNLLLDDTNIETYDKYMIENFCPGTVRAGYCYLTSFLDFLLKSKTTTEEAYKTALITITNLSSATSRADLRRRKQLRRVEAATLPKDPAKVLRQFRASTYVTAIRQQWKNGIAKVWQQMRGVLVTDMVIKNGSRCGEIRNLKYNKVLNALPFEDDPNLRTLIVEDHKMEVLYEANELYKELSDFCQVTKQALWGKNASDELFVFSTINSATNNRRVPHDIVNMWQRTAWKKAEMSGYYPGYEPSLTRNRKIITTDVRRRKAHLAEDVAQMLCHKKTTADKHYSLIDQVDRSQKTYREMYGGATEDDEQT